MCCLSEFCIALMKTTLLFCALFEWTLVLSRPLEDVKIATCSSTLTRFTAPITHVLFRHLDGRRKMAFFSSPVRNIRIPWSPVHCSPLEAGEMAFWSLFQSQPFCRSLDHWKIERWPPSAAAEELRLHQSHPFSLSHRKAQSCSTWMLLRI